ncbi:uncharacterized protein LOC114538456 [Dendronephthya gigantea]|uniref:uncharacterized protein LOC114538456 n=1 Tax=Dendronephthya gigantea TaxID=151771 RepID=UPI00106A908C|nr:uncharacterized protein LOC114538456 [Dendronephthya gigantea]
MGAFVQRLLLVCVFVAVRGSMVDVEELDFRRAFKIVENAAKQPGNIDYNTFCSKRGRGTFKFSCRMKEMPDIGLLVCLEADFCEYIIQRELLTLSILTQEGLKVLRFYPKIISGLRCGKKGSKNVSCMGFLEEWMSHEKAKEKSLRKVILAEKTQDLVTWLMNYQKNCSARFLTAWHLEKIRQFTDPKTGVYSRICDLQGYFMKDGGFTIADPDDIIKNQPLNYTCYSDEYPTTLMVIKSLKKIVDDLV